MNAQLRELVTEWRKEGNCPPESGTEYEIIECNTLVRCADELEAALAAPKEAGDAQALELAAQFEWWLRFNAASHEHDGTAVHDDMHVTPPEWPRRGNLKKWIEILRRLAAPSKEAGVLVPREPTEAMIDAALNLQGDDARRARAPALMSALRKIYLAMLAAANPPGDQRQERAGTEANEGNWLSEVFKPLPTDEVAVLRAVGAPGFEPPPEAAAAVGDQDDDVILPLALYEEINATGAQWRDRAIEAETKLAALASPTGVDEMLRDLAENGLRYSLTPCLDWTSKDTINAFWMDYMMQADRSIRERATAALAARDGGAA